MTWRSRRVTSGVLCRRRGKPCGYIRPRAQRRSMSPRGVTPRQTQNSAETTEYLEPDALLVDLRIWSGRMQVQCKMSGP